MRIAVAQAPGTTLAAWRETWRQIDDLLTEAARQRAELVVLPECVWPAYCLGSRAAWQNARAADLPAPSAFVQHLQTRARDLDLAICAGFVEEGGGELFNAAALIARDGRLLGQRSKCFLWALDRGVYAPGRQIEPLDLDGLPVGLLICADARLPEIPATLAARGAQLLLQPTAWVNAGPPEQPWNPQPDFLIPARAAEFAIPCASASKWGRELDTDFIGLSLICDRSGQILAQCGFAETRVVTANVDPAPPQPPRLSTAERTRVLSDRPPTYPPPAVPPVRLYLGPPATGVAARAAAVVHLHFAPPDESSEPVCRPDPRTVVLRGPGNDSVDVQGVRLRSFAATAAQPFAPLRIAGLEGCHLVVLFGDDALPVTVQARACENRVYVLWVRRDSVWVVDPRGLVTARLDWRAGRAPLELDLAPAADKCVAWQTDVIGDRQPATYEF